MSTWLSLHMPAEIAIRSDPDGNAARDCFDASGVWTFGPGVRAVV